MISITEKFKAFKKKLAPASDSFKSGDRVTAFGNIGTVKGISPNGMFLEVNFPDAPTTMIFHLDGKLMAWHKATTLRKV